MRSLVPTTLLLAACTNTIRFPPSLEFSTWDSGWWNTGDTGTVAEPPPRRQIEVARAECDVDHTAFTFEARSNGWILDARINVFRTADEVEEEHLMRLVETDPEGAWDQVRAGPLPDATPVGDQVPEINTRFDCEADAETLSFVVRIWGEGNVLMDCAVWGADPAAATARIRTLDPDVLGLKGCRDLGD